MNLRYKSKEDMTSSVNLLISILIRYPEVSTINYDPESRTLKFSFLFQYKFKKSELEYIEKILKDSIDVYNRLETKEPGYIEIASDNMDDYTIIKIERDVDTLIQEEIALIVQCLQQSVKTRMLIENAPYEEDLEMQEELIESMLESVKCCHESKRLFAFREEGRVLVFNK